MKNEDLINSMIDDIEDGNYNQAKGSFQDMLSAKLQDALDQEKVSVADTIYNGVGEEEEVYEDE